jgi:hypothetical protein
VEALTIFQQVASTTYDNEDQLRAENLMLTIGETVMLKTTLCGYRSRTWAFMNVVLFGGEPNGGFKVKPEMIAGWSFTYHVDNGPEPTAFAALSLKLKWAPEPLTSKKEYPPSLKDLILARKVIVLTGTKLDAHALNGLWRGWSGDL